MDNTLVTWGKKTIRSNKKVNEYELGRNIFKLKCPVCKQMHEGNILPLDWMLLRGINVKDGDIINHICRPELKNEIIN